MRIPDPKANTTTEAYLAYKAGFLEAGELKPSLYEPNLHFDAWLAYWAGLTGDYPVKNVGKNLFDKSAGHIISGYFEPNGKIIGTNAGRNQIIWLPCKPNTNYVLKSQNGVAGISMRTASYTETRPEVGVDVGGVLGNGVADKSFKTPPNAYYIVIRYQSPVGTNIQDYLQGILDTIQVEESSSSTASAYEPYSADPEMLCDEEALVAYLSGVTDTYPEEIKDPYDVRIVGYLRHLASIRWPEPDYPVNNEEFYLSNMDPTHTSNPVPSSDIELDTAEGKIISVEAYGDTYQQTYSGKNLAKVTECNISTYSYSLVISDGSVDINSITSNNWFDICGGQRAGTWVPTDVSSTADYNLTTADEGTYVFSAQNFSYTNTSAQNAQIHVVTNQRKISTAITRGATSFEPEVFTLEAGEHVKMIGVWIGANGTAELKGEFQLELGSAPTSYEPYTGGIPAPNPDYPQDIQVVTGEQNIQIGGKNLFGGTIEHGGINIANGTDNSAEDRVRTKEFVPVLPNTQYTISGVKASRFCIFYGGSQNYLGYTLVDSQQTSGTFTTIDNTAYIRWYTITTNDGIQEQLELGDTASNYVPFEGNEIFAINLGSTELCKIGDYQDYIYKSGDDWYVHKETNAKTIDGTELGWGKSTTTSNNAYYLSTKIFDDIDKDGMGVGVQNTNITPTFSRFFIAQSTNNIFTTDTVGLGFNAQQSPSTYLDLRIGVGLSSPLNTLQLFKDWLALNPVTVYYVLATATDTKITDATLIGQLEALAGADTYNEKTYIKVTATDPNLPALLKVEAYKY